MGWLPILYPNSYPEIYTGIQLETMPEMGIMDVLLKFSTVHVGIENRAKS